MKYYIKFYNKNFRRKNEQKKCLRNKKRENNGSYIIICLDYKFEEKTNKLKIFKKVEKLLKQKSKKEEKMVEDLIDIDIIQIVI